MLQEQLGQSADGPRAVRAKLSSPTKAGCPRCLAFGHLGDHQPSPSRLIHLDITRPSFRTPAPTLPSFANYFRKAPILSQDGLSLDGFSAQARAFAAPPKPGRTSRRPGARCRLTGKERHTLTSPKTSHCGTKKDAQSPKTARKSLRIKRVQINAFL